VAVGVSTRMVPVLATWAATKLTVPCTRLINAAVRCAKIVPSWSLTYVV
jgi:hypothetical protein